MVPSSMRAMAVDAPARRLREVRKPVPEPRVPLRTHVQSFALADANAALEALRAGRIEGAAVLVP